MQTPFYVVGRSLPPSVLAHYINELFVTKFNIHMYSAQSKFLVINGTMTAMACLAMTHNVSSWLYVDISS